MKDDGCLGFFTNTPDSLEFECEYEFADFGCEECIFGSCRGTQDPRVNPYEEEEE